MIKLFLRGAPSKQKSDFLTGLHDVDTHNWLPGRKVLIAPDWIRSITWSAQSITCALSQDQIRNSPEYDPTEPVNTDYEKRL